jgi:FAD synthetase
VGEGSLYAPVVRIRNVYIFPGIPKILQERFDVIKERFRGSPYFLQVVYLKEGEGVIASFLDDLLVGFPELLLGSYPVLDNPDYKVKVTLESKDQGYLSRALQKLLSTLPKGAVHRIEGN